MKILRKAADRGHFRNDWLDSFHTFSFSTYQDENWMGWGNLRVINEDKVMPAKGFATHPHNNMEIITYVLDSELEHKDSLGNGSIIKPGELQRMSAGSGITHSEFNARDDKLVHLLQIWILPGEHNVDPGYEQKTMDVAKAKNQWLYAVGPMNSGATIHIHQEAAMYVTKLEAGQNLEKELNADRPYWLQVARGKITVDGKILEAGDALGVKEESSLRVQAESDAELLLFEV